MTGERGRLCQSFHAFSRKLGKDTLFFFSILIIHLFSHQSHYLIIHRYMFSLATSISIGRRAALSISRSFATVGSQIPSGIELHSESLYWCYVVSFDVDVMDWDKMSTTLLLCLPCTHLNFACLYHCKCLENFPPEKMWVDANMYINAHMYISLLYIKCTYSYLIIIPIQPITSLYDSNIKDYCKDRNIVIVGLPAAFTPTWSTQQIPNYVENQDALRAKGVQEVIILAVNDGAGK